jgi:hypothetical protein
LFGGKRTEEEIFRLCGSSLKFLGLISLDQRIGGEDCKRMCEDEELDLDLRIMDKVIDPDIMAFLIYEK